MPAVVEFNNYLVSNSNEHGYYEIESFIHPNLNFEQNIYLIVFKINRLVNILGDFPSLKKIISV